MISLNNIINNLTQAIVGFELRSPRWKTNALSTEPLRLQID